ncbi:hypothetical protein [[Clostridium] hylemonae]|uniref:hypothetical protein n=1 Tax=[Clostridium] hylemonae TaxID=89153 RepID=UPI0011EFF93B|nr:hypothetical protein [[Clostridium] hylemonae]
MRRRYFLYSDRPTPCHNRNRRDAPFGGHDALCDLQEGERGRELTFEDIPTELFDNAKILHYGSLGMAEKTSSECMGRAIRRAREKG